MICELRLHLDKLQFAVAICDLRAEPILVKLAMCVRASGISRKFDKAKKKLNLKLKTSLVFI